MDEKRATKKARLMAKAEKLIDEYLAWEERHTQPALTEIEDIALKLRKELGEEIAQMALENHRGRKPVPGPKCPECGQEMHFKGEKGAQVESRVGELVLERGYYYCSACKKGIFPPG